MQPVPIMIDDLVTALLRMIVMPEVEYLLIVWWITGSIPHDGPIELFLIPASAPLLNPLPTDQSLSDTPTL